MIWKSNGSKQDVKLKSIEIRAKRDQPELNRTPESKVMANIVESRAADRAIGLQSGNFGLAIGFFPDRLVGGLELDQIDWEWSHSIGLGSKIEQIDRFLNRSIG